jgi:hypothetical protein
MSEKTVIAGALAVVTLGVAFYVTRAAARRPPKVEYKVELSGKPGDAIAIEQDAAPPGVLAVRARSTVKAFPFRDRMIWWEMEVRKVGAPAVDGLQLTPVWYRSYRHQAVALPAGESLPTTFDERVELPAGEYSVFLQLFEDMPTLDAGHAQIADGSPLQGEQVYVTVK